MKRRTFATHCLFTGLGAQAGLSAVAAAPSQPPTDGDSYLEPARKIPLRKFDVVVLES